MLWVIINGVLASEEDQERVSFFNKKKKIQAVLFHYFLKGNLSKTNDKCLNELHNLSQLTGIIVS